MNEAFDNVLQLIGNTPLVRLHNAIPDIHFKLFAKLERFNPGGSIKDRPAFHILRSASAAGLLHPGMTVVESSSGNMGIGLAQACRYMGFHFVCVIDPKTTLQNRRIMQAYGADLDLVSKPDAESGEYLQARLRRVRELIRCRPDSFWPNQYGNLTNALAQQQTVREIATALRGRLDVLVCSTSTCGTLRGCSEYLKTHGFATRVIAVDAIGSVIFGGIASKRLIPGHGASVRPELFRHGLADRYVHVSDFECITGCRRLLETEALLVGGSSGAALMAVQRIRDEIPEGANCALIFPDGGERYLDTIFSDDWVQEQFGRLPCPEWRSADDVDLLAHLTR